jgi:RNA polymerase sigma factor (sigma-70 family)
MILEEIARSLMTTSDRDLIRTCRSGDANAWERLLDKYERLVYSIPLNYGLPGDDAADITQVTFTILLQNLDTLPDEVPLGAWLSTVARRHTWRLLARQRRETIGPDEDIASDEALGGIVDDRERWELIQWLNDGLSLLDERCCRLLSALYFDEQQPSYSEVGERLNMPVGSIGPTRARCLERLKRLLPPGFDPKEGTDGRP